MNRKKEVTLVSMRGSEVKTIKYEPGKNESWVSVDTLSTRTGNTIRDWFSSPSQADAKKVYDEVLNDSLKDGFEVPRKRRGQRINLG